MRGEHLHRLRLAIAVLLAAVCFSACGSCTPPGQCGGTGGRGFSGGGTAASPTVTLGTNGSPILDTGVAHVSLAQPAPPNCLTPDSVTVVVRDPNDNAVPSSAVLTSANGGSIDVFFDAGQAGWYYAQADVQPNIGLSEAQVLLVSDRLQADAGLVANAPNGTCIDLGRTTFGTWICDGSPLRSDGGGNAITSAVAGNVVWVFDQSLSRYTDDAGALALSAMSASDLAVMPPAPVFPSEQDAVLVDNTAQLWWFQLDGGVLQQMGSPLLMTATVAPLSALRAGSTVFVAGATPQGLDGGVTSCRVDLTASGLVAVDAGACQTFPGQLSGADGRYFWVVDGSGRLGAYAVDGGSLSFVASMPLSQDLNPVTAPGGSLSIQFQNSTSFAVIPQVVGGAVVLEQYDRAPQPVQGANERFVWEFGGGVAAKVFFR